MNTIDGKMKEKKITQKKFEKNKGIPINLPTLINNRQLDVLVQKMHAGDEE